MSARGVIDEKMNSNEKEEGTVQELKQHSCAAIEQ